MRWDSAASASRLQDLVQLYAGFARLGTTKPLREIMVDQRDARTHAADGPGRRLAGRQCPDRHAAAGKRRAQPDRLQDRHQLRLPRRLVGRFRRPHHRSASGSAGPTARRCRADRPHRRGADPVRRLRAHRKDSGGTAEAAEGRAGRRQCQTAAAAAAVPPLGRTGAHRQRSGAAHPVPAERLADRRRPLPTTASSRRCRSRLPAACCR